MVLPENPYNCTKPGNLFVGHTSILEKILNGLVNGHSYAVLGGRRAGKTSLLLELKKKLSAQNETTNASSHHCMLPMFLDMQQFGTLNTAIFFEVLYSLIAKNAQIPAWVEVDESRAYEGFLRHMRKAKPALDKQFGRRWLVVFLTDELDIAADRMPDDEAFQNLRNLLMMSEFAHHVRLVASGVKGMQNLIASGSPLNNLRSTYLSVLSGPQAAQLLHAGFDDSVLSPEVCSAVYSLSGRHPCLMQALLEYLWTYSRTGQKDLTFEPTERAAREFLREHHFFSSWWDTFGVEEHAAYKALAESHKQSDTAQIEHVGTYSDDALTVLSYHGVVDDHDPAALSLSGTLFRDWYLNKCDLDLKKDKSVVSDTSTTREISVTTSYIKIFLASSSELADTRDQIELFLLRKNQNNELNGLNIEVVRWENFLDAMSEDGLQAEYNKAVVTSDVFISLFRTKTGTYTEQEFDIAHQAFLKNGFPKIYTMFEKALVSTNANNKDSLNSLWEFQDKLKKLKHYQTNYNNIEDLQLKLSQQLKKLVDGGVFECNRDIIS